MKLGKQKDLASRALNVSKKRIKFSTDSKVKSDLKEIISRESVKELVENGSIRILPKKGNSRTRANKIAEQKKKGRRQGHGSRKGTANARFNNKDKWMIKIRSLRKLLKKLKDDGKLETKVYRDLYMKSKGNFFRNKRHMMLYIEQNHLLTNVEKESSLKPEEKKEGSKE
jgi:large subunit ribosomal protein L19e